MFARTVTIKGKKYWRIVKSYRVNGKVKQAYVCSMGEGELGEENVKYFFDDTSDFEEKLDRLKDNPKLKHLVNRLSPGVGYEGRRKGENNNIWSGRAKKHQCPEKGEAVTLRVLKDTGLTICFDASLDKTCKSCEWNDSKQTTAKK